MSRKSRSSSPTPPAAHTLRWLCVTYVVAIACFPCLPIVHPAAASLISLGTTPDPTADESPALHFLSIVGSRPFYLQTTLRLRGVLPFLPPSLCAKLRALRLEKRITWGAAAVRRSKFCTCGEPDRFSCCPLHLHLLLILNMGVLSLLLQKFPNIYQRVKYPQKA